jgi:hypothetical protein
MLRRINAGLYEEDEGRDIELAVKAQNNNGTESAQFDYDSTVLNQDTVQGLPGCRFRVKPGTRQFRALVAFDPAAPPTARYDLFQVNEAGTLIPVGKSVTNTFGTPLIGFGIGGVSVAVPVGAGGARRKMPKPPRRASRKTMSSRRNAPVPTPITASVTSRKPPASSRKGKAKTATRPKPKVAARKLKSKQPRSQERAKRISKKKR